MRFDIKTQTDLLSSQNWGLGAITMKNLLLIESPGKIRKLAQILGSNWTIKASMGHVRELANDGEDSLGFDLTGDRIDCRYEARGSRGSQVLSELRQAVKRSAGIYNRR
jgi:DNA topoisomerase I